MGRSEHERYCGVTTDSAGNGTVAKAGWESADKQNRNSGFRERQRLGASQNILRRFLGQPNKFKRTRSSKCLLES